MVSGGREAHPGTMYIFISLQVIEGDIELESRGSWCDNSHTVKKF